MQQRIVTDARRTEDSVLATNKVLRNTYFLLALSVAFSALTAYVSMVMNLPRPGLIVMLVGFYGLLFLTHKLADSALGILSTFAFTGFLGYTVGPILNAYVRAGLGDVVVLAFGGTAAVFFACSAYVLTTKKDMSFLGGMLFSLFIVLVIGVVASLFFNFEGLHLALSALFVLFSTGAILYETSNIVHGGETNYIRATISIYVSLYNLFISLLNLIGASRD
ncbi:modulator of FtsH protease [Pasteurella testudinis DSM 23072]|uniref:Modulator of FtsH protease n=1 Tax=Pasteurella testudinis DSM 23072 TaxID=1122938 RepID=A0A1W1UC11_9PAST|nr:Bax inhibitor-1 family protein [Pasteurella testudinis]SMB78607.1 modulator of FtsH protease [Pasteurella testudinis DSM 23072]SUB52541.1 inner membrane protein YccA [Pasteurella testudinis]